MNLDKVKFTCLDLTYLFLCRFNFSLTLKNLDEKPMLVFTRKINSPVEMTSHFELNQHNIVSARFVD